MHSGPASIDALLDAFLDARSQARRFHGESLGPRVDPGHCLGDFLCRVRVQDSPGIAKHYFPEVAKSGSLSELSGPGGGYLVPEEFSAQCLRDLSTGSLFRRYGAYVHPMTTESVTLSTLDVSRAHAAGVAPYYGTLQLTWEVDNQSSLPRTLPYFRDVQLNAGVLAGYVYASNALVQDALGLEAWFYRLLTDALAWYQDYAFFQGNGAGKPQGVIGAAGAVSISRTGSGGSAGKIVASNVQAMIAALLPQSFDGGCPRAKWFCHPTALAQFNNTNFPGWISNSSMQMYGLPVIPTGKCSTLGTPGDLILADPTLYVIGDRRQLEVAYSANEPAAYLTNKSALRVWSRVAGDCLVGSPVTLADGVSTVSPFVILS